MTVPKGRFFAVLSRNDAVKAVNFGRIYRIYRIKKQNGFRNKGSPLGGCSWIGS
jgi:hypothetical protein